MTDINDDPRIGIRIENLPEDVIEIRQVGFGLGLPKILLSLEEDEDGEGVTFTALTAGFDSAEEMIAMAREHLDVLEMGVKQESDDNEEAQP